MTDWSCGERVRRIRASVASGSRHPDGHERACLDLRPVTVELQLRQSSGRKTTLDRMNRLRGGAGRVCHLVHQARCARSVSDEQRNAAIVRKLTDGVDQRIAACVVETLGDFHAIRRRRITQFEQLERLSRAGCARAQDRVDRDALAAQVVAHLERVAFAVGVSRRSLSGLPGRVSSVCAWRSTSRVRRWSISAAYGQRAVG